MKIIYLGILLISNSLCSQDVNFKKILEAELYTEKPIIQWSHNEIRVIDNYDSINIVTKYKLKEVGDTFVKKEFYKEKIKGRENIHNANSLILNFNIDYLYSDSSFYEVKVENSYAYHSFYDGNYEYLIIQDSVSWDFTFLIIDEKKEINYDLKLG